MKKFEVTLVGENYFSYLLGLRYLAQGKRVVLIEDPRVSLGSFFSNHIGDFELSFFKTWGGLYQLKALQSIENYLEPFPYTITLDQSILLLGRGRLDNLRELTRKLPALFKAELPSDDQFNHEFQSYCNWLSGHFLGRSSQQPLSTKVFFEKVPSFLKEIHQRLSSENLKESLPAETFYQRFLVFTFRSFFQFQLSEDGSDFEILHLILSLLGQRYKLDQAKLIKDLKKHFIENGGFIQSEGVESCNQVKSRFAQTHYFGGPHLSLPIQPMTDFSIYSSFSMKIESNKKLPSCFDYQGIVVFQTHFGSDIPFFYFEKVGEQNILLTVPYLDSETTKYSFYLNDALRYFKDWAEHFCGDTELFNFEKIIDERIHNEIWIENDAERVKSKSYYLQSYSKTQSVMYQSPGKFKKVKNHKFFGPLSNYNLGLSALLVDLKTLVQE